MIVAKHTIQREATEAPLPLRLPLTLYSDFHGASVRPINHELALRQKANFPRLL